MLLGIENSRLNNVLVLMPTCNFCLVLTVYASSKRNITVAAIKYFIKRIPNEASRLKYLSYGLEVGRLSGAGGLKVILRFHVFLRRCSPGISILLPFNECAVCLSKFDELKGKPPSGLARFKLSLRRPSHMYHRRPEELPPRCTDT